MTCEFDYCIYNKEYACILDGIQINSLGMCEACEIVAVPGEILEADKAARLKKIKETWENFDK